MLKSIRKTLDKELLLFLNDINRAFSLNKTSRLLYSSIKDFVLREGKRLRPTLFLLGYQGYSDKEPKGLYKSALAIEFLHDFMLVHDDIIDKSALRRGKPALHVVLDKKITAGKKNKISFDGEALAIVAGDLMYAIGIEAFLAVSADKPQKEDALKILMEAAIYTAMGEFIELEMSIKDIAKIKQSDIYKIYDYKTAYYTFACPLASGATLAKAPKKDIERLSDFGMSLGRAFQIKDDILGLFSQEDITGKSLLSDLQESKKTLIIWQAHKNATAKDRKIINGILNKDRVSSKDLSAIQRLAEKTGALDYAKSQIIHLRAKSRKELDSLRIRAAVKDSLSAYIDTILTI